MYSDSDREINNNSSASIGPRRPHGPAGADFVNHEIDPELYAMHQDHTAEEEAAMDPKENLIEALQTEVFNLKAANADQASFVLNLIETVAKLDPKTAAAFTSALPQPDTALIEARTLQEDEMKTERARFHCDLIEFEQKLENLKIEVHNMEVKKLYMMNIQNNNILNVSFNNYQGQQQGPPTPPPGPFGVAAPTTLWSSTSGPQVGFGQGAVSAHTPIGQAMSMFGSQSYLPGPNQAGFGQGTVSAPPRPLDQITDMIDPQLSLPPVGIASSPPTMASSLPVVAPTETPPSVPQVQPPAQSFSLPIRPASAGVPARP